MGCERSRRPARRLTPGGRICGDTSGSDSFFKRHRRTDFARLHGDAGGQAALLFGQGRSRGRFFRSLARVGAANRGEETALTRIGPLGAICSMASPTGFAADFRL
jgi:hypothetical protein